MAHFLELIICGLWVSNGVSEDCIVLVGYKHEHDTVKLLAVETCHGSISGTDYFHQLNVSPALREHLRDMILERFEC